MVFAYDSEVALQCAVDLVNSAEEPDTLTSLTALDDFLRRYQFTGRRDRSRTELETVRALRPVLRELLTADREQAVGLINERLTEVTLRPQLARHDDYDWHLHAVDYDDPLAERILVETVMAMIDVVRSDENSRLSVCEDVACEGVVLDLSRNRSRRFCSTTCGNRNAVAAYRARQAR